MSVGYAERLTPEPESPFVDGQNLRFFDRETSWETAIAGDRITLTCTDPRDYTYFSSDREAAKGRLRLYPATGEIFGYSETPEGFPSFSVPTVPAANAFAARRFEGLPVAGIQASQESDLGNTSAPRYLHDLGAAPPRLPVAFGPAGYFHDILDHWLGAAAVDTQSYAVFKTLSEDALESWAKGPQWPSILTVQALASGFDTFTGSLIRNAMKPGVGAEGYLLSRCLQALSIRNSEALPRAIGILGDFGMSVESGFRRGLIVPWEMDNLPAHYTAVAERLR